MWILSDMAFSGMYSEHQYNLQGSKSTINLLSSMMRFTRSWTHVCSQVISNVTNHQRTVLKHNLGYWLEIPPCSPTARSALSGKKMNAACISLQGHTSHLQTMYHSSVWLNAKCNWHSARISIGNIKLQVSVPPENPWVIFLLYRALLIFNNILFL